MLEEGGSPAMAYARVSALEREVASLRFASLYVEPIVSILVSSASGGDEIPPPSLSAAIFSSQELVGAPRLQQFLPEWPWMVRAVLPLLAVQHSPQS